MVKYIVLQDCIFPNIYRCKGDVVELNDDIVVPKHCFSLSESVAKVEKKEEANTFSQILDAEVKAENELLKAKGFDTVVSQPVIEAVVIPEPEVSAEPEPVIEPATELSIEDALSNELSIEIPQVDEVAIEPEVSAETTTVKSGRGRPKRV
jgi:hypothetical protein